MYYPYHCRLSLDMELNSSQQYLHCRCIYIVEAYGAFRTNIDGENGSLGRYFRLKLKVKMGIKK